MKILFERDVKLYGVPTKLVVAEDRPQQRIVKINFHPHRKVFYLNFPYLQYYHLYDALYVTASEKSFLVDDNVFRLCLPNQYDVMGGFCLGDYVKYQDIQDAVDAFWQKSFNETLLENAIPDEEINNCYDFKAYQFNKLKVLKFYEKWQNSKITPKHSVGNGFRRMAFHSREFYDIDENLIKEAMEICKTNPKSAN